MSFGNHKVLESCEREVAFRRLLPAFRVLSSSVLRFCNHEFAFGYYLAAFQSRVRVLPSSSNERVKVLQPLSRVTPSLAIAAFQTRSSRL